MKNLLFPLLVMIGFTLTSQNIIGTKWSINEVPGREDDNNQEFFLYKIDSTDNFNSFNSKYGTKIIFKNDNTFESFYTAECGNDCFPSSNGTFKIKDQKHIELFVKKYAQHGECETLTKSNINLGLYYIHEESNKKIKLIKSDGIAEHDKNNVKYADLIEKYADKVYQQSIVPQSFKTSKKDNISRAQDFVKKNTSIKNFEIVFVKKLNNYFYVNLIKNLDAKDEYYYLTTTVKSEKEYDINFYKVKW